MKNRFAAMLLSAVALLLAACGGGGVATPPSANTAGLAIQPGTVDLFPDTPTTFTISGGTAPYQVNSSNSSVLPLTSAVQGSTFIATPNNVAADTAVTLTVTDATGKTATATATVRQSTLLNLVTIASPSSANCPSALCSGGDATATISVVRNGVPQANRSIRFSVESGAFSLVTPGSGALVNSLTVTTDQSGIAIVTLRAAAGTPSQNAILRITDVTSNQSRLFAFTITQTVSTTAISIIPSTVTWTGTYTSSCVVGGVSSHYIYGGTPPYTITSTAPAVATVAPSVVTQSGAAVSVTVLGVNSVGQIACTTASGVPILVTDATGRFTTFTVVNTVGTTTPPSGGVGVLPAPVLNPTSLGPIDCGVSTSAFVTQTVPAGYTGPTPVLTATSLEPSRLSATIANGVLTVTRLTTGGSGTAPIIVRVSNGVTYTDVDVALIGSAPYGCASAGGSNNPIQVSTTTSLTLKNGTAIPVTIAGGVPPYVVSTSAPTVIQVSTDGSTYYTPGWANIFNTATPPVIVAEAGWSCVQPTTPLPAAPTLPMPTPSTGPASSMGTPLGLTGMGTGPGQNGNTCYVFVGTPNSQLTNQFTLRALLTNAIGQVGFVTITDSSSPTRFTQVIVVTVN